MQTYWPDDWMKTCKKGNLQREQQVGDLNPQIPKHFHDFNPPTTLSHNQRTLNVEHDGRKEEKKAEERAVKVRCAASGPWQGVTLSLMKQWHRQLVTRTVLSATERCAHH